MECNFDSIVTYNPVYRCKNVNEAFEQLFKDVVESGNGKTNPSRDGDVVGELINAVIVIEDPTRNIVTSSIRKMPVRYAVGELLWYLSGSNRLSDIANFSKAWENLSDDGETVNSAYGHRIFEQFGFDQWELVKSKLISDPLSRQAVIHIKDASNKPTKDTPCTCSLQFFIRDGALHLTVYMRSNDLWLGFPYDVFSFTCMQIKMAFELGVNIGTYTHIAGSLHMYRRNLPV